MKVFKSESVMIHICLIIICLYFVCFFCFSSFQTLLSGVLSDSKRTQKVEKIIFVANQISSEMPIEKREEWIDSFPSNSELLYLSSVLEARQIIEAYDHSEKVSRSAPLSILSF